MEGRDGLDISDGGLADVDVDAEVALVNMLATEPTEDDDEEDVK